MTVAPKPDLKTVPMRVNVTLAGHVTEDGEIKEMAGFTIPRLTVTVGEVAKPPSRLVILTVNV